MNKGLAFEWCIYHLVAKVYPDKFKNDSVAKTAKDNYLIAPADVKENALKAIKFVEKEFGKITDIEKTSGGGIEPKTDLLIKTKSKELKCSLKYGGDVQLSSGGISTTVKFLAGVIENLAAEEKYDSEKSIRLLTILAELDETYGNLGKITRQKADVEIGKAQRYDVLLKEILGSSKTPKVSEEYQKVKNAIVEEAMTGKYTFKHNQKLSANYILSEKEIQFIDNKLIQKVADKTSVRISLKGRGKTMVAGKEVRLNEIVVRFDTKK
jgi:hypothetical protein